MESIKGRLIRKIFSNESSGYAVLIFNSEDHDEVVVNGQLNQIDHDNEYELFGEFNDHPKYGLQFKVDFFNKITLSNKDSLIDILSSENFSGIGKKSAEKIVEHFGLDVIEMLTTDKSLIEELSFLNKAKRESLADGLEQLKNENEQFLLHSLGIVLSQIKLLEKYYPNGILSSLRTNPYEAMIEHDGIGFKTCDKLAKYFGISEDDIIYLKARFYSEINNYLLETGDTYFDYEFINRLNNHYLNSGYNIFALLIEEGVVVVDEQRFYLKYMYKCEIGISRILQEFPYVPFKEVHISDVEHAIGLVENREHISYDESQQSAITQFYDNDILVITGGPGTGKTTILNGIVKTLQIMEPLTKIALCAPTGRAAKRMSEVTDQKAQTIHSLLKWNVEDRSFSKNANDPLDYDILIIDEFSMVDQQLFYKMLLATRPIKKILIIGDANQLPSILPGDVLADLIASSKFKVITLDKIYRQEEGSSIIELAHSINNNTPINFENTKNLMYVQCSSYQMNNTILDLFKRALHKGYDLEDIQVLAPMYKGLHGIDNLNKLLQLGCNEEALALSYQNIKYQINDKVIQLVNQVNDDIYNGDIGIIDELDLDNNDAILDVRYDDKIVTYSYENLKNIKLAYAISIHKSQGSEYPIVIIPLHRSFNKMLSKKLVYTAITRAKRSLIIIGDLSLLNQAQQTQDRRRQTSLAFNL